MMNQYLFTYSESIVLSLTKEIEYIKSRTKSINQSLKNCQNTILSTRLKSELQKLNKNRLRILAISENLINRNCTNLSFKFLLEITKRTNSHQKI